MGLGQKLIGALFQYGGDKLIIAVDDTVTMVSNGQAAPISARAIAQEQFDSIVLELGPEGFTPLPGSSFVYRGADKPVRGVLIANQQLELTVTSDSDSALRMPRLLDPPSNPEISTFPPRPPSSTADMKEAPPAPTAEHDAPRQADTRSDSPPSVAPPAPPMSPAPDLQPGQTSGPPSSAEKASSPPEHPPEDPRLGTRNTMSASDFRLVDWTRNTPIPNPPSFLQAIASEMLEKRLLRARLDPHAKAWLQQARQWLPAESQTISSSSLLEQLEAILNPAIRSQLERDEHARLMLTISPERRLLVELFRELDGPSCLLSMLPAHVPEADSLGLPAALLELLQRRSGILILAAPPGNGLSTTLAVCAQSILKNDNRLLLYVGHNPMLSPHGRLCVMPHERAHLEPGPLAPNACTSKRSPIWHSHFDVLLADGAHGELSAELIESASTRLVIMSSQSLSLSSACEALLAHTPLNSQSYLRRCLAQRVIGYHAQVLCQSRENQPVLASTLTLPTPALRVLLENGWNAPTSALFTAIETLHQKSTISDEEREHWRQQLLNETD